MHKAVVPEQSSSPPSAAADVAPCSRNWRSVRRNASLCCVRMRVGEGEEVRARQFSLSYLRPLVFMHVFLSLPVFFFHPKRAAQLFFIIFQILFSFVEF
jgi:hypothetical protein